MLLAIPFDLEGGTQGEDEAETVRMAADWLRTEIEMRLMCEEPIPQPVFGHHAVHRGGRILIVSVEVDLDHVDTVAVSDAADMLGVSRSRVSQMMKSGQLMGYRKGRATFVTRDSVQARLMESPGPGRPRKRVSA